MLEFLPFAFYEAPSPVIVSGESLTVPNLAPELVTLLESAVFGDKLPDNGMNNYDDSEELGFERTSRPHTFDGVLNMPEVNLTDKVSSEVSTNEEVTSGTDEELKTE